MKLKLLTAAGTAALMAVPTFASADDAGWYLRGNAGYGVHTDVDLTGDVVGDTESQGNFAWALGVGYEFANNWRVEFDKASLWTDMGKVSGYPQTGSKLQTSTMMINAIYDFEDFGSWEPYVGAGIGYVRGQTTTVANDFPSAPAGTPGAIAVNNPACPTAVACGFKDGDNGRAWQLIAGLGYNVSENLVWDTQYRYLDAGTLDFDGVKAPSFGTTTGAQFSMEDVGAHSLMTGFRYKFGAKAKPMQTCWDGSEILMSSTCPDRPIEMKTCWDNSRIPASDTCPARPVPTQTCWDNSVIPATSTCPARTYTCQDGSVVSDLAICPRVSLCTEAFRSEIIYYEFDKGRSAETRNAISRVLDVGQYCNVDNIRVVGHTDTSGSAAYNLALSKRRAKDASDELVRQGMSAAAIASEGMGETQPRIQTGDGVKERENRRTEVLLQLSEVRN